MAASLLAVLCVWTLCVYLLIYGIRTNVTHKKIILSDDYNYFLMTDEGYEFDTGTNIFTFTNTEKVGSSYRIGWELTWDAKNHRLNFLRYGEECQIGKELYISDFAYTTGKETVHSKSFPLIKGIIGMNVIQKANWLFSLKAQKAETFPLDSIVPIPTDAVTLSYRGWLRPLTNLNINGYRVKNVLIDTGFNRDLLLSDTTLMAEFGEVIRQDTVECITFDEKRMAVENIFNSVNINSKPYQNVNVSYNGQSENLIGLGFMRRFDYLFWDSKHKKVYLWNEKPSENS